MTWRTALAVGIVVSLCYMANMTIWETIGVTLLCLFIGWIVRVYGYEWWTERQRSNMLTLRFATGEEEHVWPEVLPAGESKHTLRVRFRFGVDLRDIGLRFLSHEEAARPLGTGNPADISHKISIAGMAFPSFPGPRSKVTDGGRGGHDCEFNPPISIGKDKILAIEIIVNAKEPGWAGVLSCQILDVDSKRMPRIARCPVEVSQ